LNTAIMTPSFRERYALIGDDPSPSTPDQFAAFIRSEHAKWGEVVRRSGTKVD
jgi:tripartite-type tricarboxylate transporter receptor subunit TctC